VTALPSRPEIPGTTASSSGTSAPAFLEGGGELGTLIAAFDWSRTPLGAIEDWSDHLATVTGLVVRSAVPIVLLWGEAGTLIYNDAYAVFAGGRHPGLLGKPVLEAWPEVADFNANVMRVGLAGGKLSYREQELRLQRPGRPEQVWLDLDYAPVLDRVGMAVGVIAVVVEQTDRILAERARDRAEQRAEDVLESIDEGFLLLDDDFRVVTINAAAMRNERQSRDEIVGRLQWEAWPEVERGEFGALCRRVMAEGGSGELEHRYVWPDGRAAWIEARLYRTGDGLAIFYRDVTARRRENDRQVALLAFGDRLRDLRQPELIAEAAGAAIGEALGVSQAAYAVVHADGDTLTVLTPWLRQANVPSLAGPRRFSDWGAFAEELHGGKPVVIGDAFADPLTSHRRASFEGYGIRAFVNVPLLGGGQMVGMILAIEESPRIWSPEELGFLRSVADRTWAALRTAEAEARLVALNHNLEQLVEDRTAELDRVWRHSQDLLIVVDGKGLIRAANPAWTRVLGWEPGEILGRHHLEMNHPDHREASEAARAQALASRLPSYECRILHKDGTFRWISWVAAAEGDAVYASGRDVTEEKKAEGELARTQELLRQAQKMEAVGQLTGGIAHDFNNLLGAISGSLELLERRLGAGRTDGLQRYTTAAITAAQRAAALTQRLLAFARRQPLDPKRVEANRLLADMEDLLRRTLGPAVSLEMVLSGGLWPTLCDPHQLESAVLNLAINARDAMPDGGKLTVETANAHLDDAYVRAHGADLKPGQYVVVAVTDTGTGMPPDIVEKAFDPFFTTKPLGQGTGLGLSMLYGFVKQSEGHVRIYSEVGVGSTVKLYLPRLRADTADDETEAGQIEAAPRAEVGETVLVVDDEPTLRMLVTETLEDLGYAAVEAEDGTSALKVIQSDARIDLLVTDVGLPGMNGRQLADAARSLRPGLRVLFITGYAHNAALGQGDALDDGMEMVTKPFALDVLASKIRQMIESR
jgi:PAS domain S-box-containing protein